MTIEYKYVDVLVDLACALRGRVTRNLRALYVTVEDLHAFTYTFYYDDPPSEDEEELASLVDTSVLCDFSATHRTDCKVASVKYPQEIRDSGLCVYHRYEESFQRGDSEVEAHSSLLKQVELLTKTKGGAIDEDDPEGVREDRRLKVLLSAQSALRWHVTPNLRAVYVKIVGNNEREYTIYYDQVPSPLEMELVNLIKGEILEECASTDLISFNTLRVNISEKINDSGFCIYRRYEQ